MWRPGKVRFLIGVKNRFHIRPSATARREPLPSARAAAGFATTVGLRPPCVSNPAALSHPVCRAARWRNRTEFPEGRAAIEAFLTRKWQRELDYRLIKEISAFRETRIAVRFAYE
jgi:Protein of unknown function (DUF1348)